MLGLAIITVNQYDLVEIKHRKWITHTSNREHCTLIIVTTSTNFANTTFAYHDYSAQIFNLTRSPSPGTLILPEMCVCVSKCSLFLYTCIVDIVKKLQHLFYSPGRFCLSTYLKPQTMIRKSAGKNIDSHIGFPVLTHNWTPILYACSKTRFWSAMR